MIPETFDGRTHPRRPEPAKRHHRMGSNVVVIQEIDQQRHRPRIPELINQIETGIDADHFTLHRR